jgi:ribosomal-protein-alanine N-acetyltransferase
MLPLTIHLLPLGPELAQRIAGGQPQNEISSDQLVPIVREVARAQYRLYQKTGATEPWIGYLALESAGGDAPIVGACSFKSMPHDGRVEIAYFTFSGHEGRGVARRMATALLDIADRSAAVFEVWAHTLPVVNASTCILNRLAFDQLGPVQDPEDGLVWRWVRKSRKRSSTQ